MITKKVKFLFPDLFTWEKLLMRWSDFPVCGEKKLICAVIARAIVDQHDSKEMDPVAKGHCFFGKPLEKYCRWLDMSAVYVREQVLMASRRDGEMVEIAA